MVYPKICWSWLRSVDVLALNGKEVEFYYPRLVLIYGEYCFLCGKIPMELNVEKLEIHEIKYERPLRIGNMRLLCHGCNHIKILNKENIEGGETVPVNYRQSRVIHPIFLEYISGKMQEAIKDGCDYNTLLADTILYTGMRKQTIQNWFFPLYQGTDSPYVMWGDRLYLKGREPRGKIQDLVPRDEELTEKQKLDMK